MKSGEYIYGVGMAIAMVFCAYLGYEIERSENTILYQNTQIELLKQDRDRYKRGQLELQNKLNQERHGTGIKNHQQSDPWERIRK